MFHKSLKFFIFFLVSIQADNDCPCQSREVLIRDTRSLFLLEGNFVDGTIQIRRDHNLTDQHWILKPSKNIGSFNIINVNNKYALDLNRTSYDSDSNSFLVTDLELEDTLSQQWYIHWDGSIVNGATKDFALRLANDNYTEENFLVASPRVASYYPTMFVFEFLSTEC